MRISFEDTAVRLKETDDIIILTHRKPDGDTLGSAAALCLGLRQLGKRAYLLPNGETTARYESMVSGLWAPEGFKPQLICSVDVADRVLFTKNVPERVDLAIDHHPSHRDYAEEIYCRPEAAACGEIIFELLKAMGCRLNKEIAGALYTAVSTDTGCFRFNNTTAHSHMVAAACFEAGADWQEINYRCFRLKTRARTSLEGYIFSNLASCLEGRGVVAVITRELIGRLNATDDDLDNLSSLLSETEGVEVAALLTETAARDGFKVSMRSGRWDVSQICSRFGGGGHAGAAGCTLNNMDSDAALKTILSAIEEKLNG